MTSSLYFDDALEEYLEIRAENRLEPEFAAWMRRGNNTLINPTFADVAALATSILDRSVIHKIKVLHLTGNLPLGEQVLLVKSAKGSGKTTALKAHLGDNAKVLVVAHRNSLVGKLAHDFGLRHHLEKPGKEGVSAYLSNRLAVTLNSLWKVQRRVPYDVVVLDESEQVLSHFFSGTMKGRENANLQALLFAVRKAKQVIAMDADLSWTTLNFVGTALPDAKLTIIRNTHQPAQGSRLGVFHDKRHLEDVIVEALKTQRCFIVSDEKRYLQRLAVRLREAGKGKILEINSDTATNAEVLKFLHDPVANTARYSAILASPTIMSGIDLSFPSDEVVFERVFGVFHGSFMTHHECDQLLSRVRQTLRMDVWITQRNLEPRRHILLINGEMGEEVSHIRQSVLDQTIERVRALVRNTILQGYGADGTEIFCTNHPLINIARTVVSSRLSSRQFLAANFIAAKKAEGWLVEEMTRD